MLSSDKLLFTNGKTRLARAGVDLDKKTNVIAVVVQARASGEFKLSVALLSPDDGLVLTSGAGRASGPRPPRSWGSSCRSGPSPC